MSGESAAYRRHPEGYWAESVEFAPTLMAIPGDADNAALVISGGQMT